MKQTIYFSLFTLLTIFSSCKNDGELIQAQSYGELNVQVNIPEDADHLRLIVDGAVKDTLTSDGNKLILERGQRKLTIVNSQNQTLVDTTINLTGSKSATLRGIYTGSTILFDNLDPAIQPSKPDRSLVRFVIKEATLPNVLDLKFVLYYASGGSQYRTTALELKGVSKTSFSNYIEFENPRTLFTDIPEGVTSFRYYIEAYDPNDNNKKVMDINMRTHCAIKFTGTETLPIFAPGYITSMAIGAPNATGVYQAEIVFERPATQN